MKQQTEPMHPILAKFHEAKEAGFEWADDAINAFDERFASDYDYENYYVGLTYRKAIENGFWWRNNESRDWERVWNDLKAKGL